MLGEYVVEDLLRYIGKEQVADLLFLKISTKGSLCGISLFALALRRVRAVIRLGQLV